MASIGRFQFRKSALKGLMSLTLMHAFDDAMAAITFFFCRLRMWTRLAPVFKIFLINVPYHILVASLTLMALF